MSSSSSLSPMMISSSMDHHNHTNNNNNSRSSYGSRRVRQLVSGVCVVAVVCVALNFTVSYIYMHPRPRSRQPPSNNHNNHPSYHHPIITNPTTTPSSLKATPTTTMTTTTTGSNGPNNGKEASLEAPTKSNTKDPGGGIGGGVVGVEHSGIVPVESSSSSHTAAGHSFAFWQEFQSAWFGSDTDSSIHPSSPSTTTHHHHNNETKPPAKQFSSSSSPPSLRPTTVPPSPSPTVPPTKTSSSSSPPSKKQSHASSTSGRHSSNSSRLPPLVPYQYRPPPLPLTPTNTSRSFQQKWCNFHAPLGRTVDWYEDATSWHRRAPAVVVAGVKYSGGTTLLAQLLTKHVQIVPPGPLETQFFLDGHVRKYVSSTTQVTNVHAARQRLYHSPAFYDPGRLQQDPNVISLDATPGYLLYSSVTPRRLLCIAPWVQLVVVLQDPIVRILRHYHAAQQRGLPLSLQEWVEKDWKLLSKLGLDNTSATYVGSPEQDVAWYDYTSTSLEAVLGRSLYDIQLRQWLQAIVGMGRSPRTTLLVLNAQDMATNPQAYVEMVLDFIGVNATAPLHFKPNHNHNNHNNNTTREDVWKGIATQLTTLPLYTRPRKAGTKSSNASLVSADDILSHEFRQRLHTLFAPHQAQLPHTLHHFGLQISRPETYVSPHKNNNKNRKQQRRREGQEGRQRQQEGRTQPP